MREHRKELVLESIVLAQFRQRHALGGDVLEYDRHLAAVLAPHREGIDVEPATHDIRSLDETPGLPAARDLPIHLEPMRLQPRN